MSTSIFITYNPNSEPERTLAIRLHTIGAVNGFTMYLPDRYNSETHLDHETKLRIQSAMWFVCFSTQSLSEIVLQEINYALQTFPDRRKIIVVYAATTGRKIANTHELGLSEICIDPRTDTIDQSAAQILKKIWETDINEKNQAAMRKQIEQAEKDKNALLALLGIGVGFLALSVLSSDEKSTSEKKRSKSTKKKN